MDAVTLQAAKIAAGKQIAVPRLYSPQGLRRFRRRLADVLNVQLNVVCYGDSITWGQAADNYVGGGGATIQAAYRRAAWTPALRKMLAAQFGYTDPGEGYLWLDTAANDTRLTYTSATAQGTIAPHQAGYALVSGGSITFAKDVGAVECDILSWNPNSGGGALTYGWDAATAPGSAVTTGAADTFSKTTVTAPDNGAHTLKVFGPASGTGYLSMLGQWNVAAASRVGVACHRIGKAGTATDAASGLNNFTGSNQDRIMRATFAQTAADLAIFYFGANDYWYQPGSGHTPNNTVTPTTFASNLQNMINAVTSQNGKALMTTPGCVLLVAGSRRQAWDTTPATPTYAESAYYAAMKNLAATNDHVAFLDLSEAWGTNAQALASGIVTTTDVHPLRIGHGDTARIIQRAITSPAITVT